MVTCASTIKGIFKPPAGGSPFGPVTISAAPFDPAYQQPENLFTFINMHGGENDANQAALERTLKEFPNAKVADAVDSSSTTRSRV